MAKRKKAHTLRPYVEKVRTDLEFCDTYEGWMNHQCTTLDFIKHQFAGKDGIVEMFFSPYLEHKLFDGTYSNTWPFFVVKRLLTDYDGITYAEFKIYDRSAEKMYYRWVEYDNLDMTPAEFWDLDDTQDEMNYYFVYLRDLH